MICVRELSNFSKLNQSSSGKITPIPTGLAATSNRLHSRPTLALTSANSGKDQKCVGSCRLHDAPFCSAKTSPKPKPPADS